MKYNVSAVIWLKLTAYIENRFWGPIRSQDYKHPYNTGIYDNCAPSIIFYPSQCQGDIIDCCIIRSPQAHSMFIQVESKFYSVHDAGTPASASNAKYSRSLAYSGVFCAYYLSFTQSNTNICIDEIWQYRMSRRSTVPRCQEYPCLVLCSPCCLRFSTLATFDPRLPLTHFPWRLAMEQTCDASTNIFG